MCLRFINLVMGERMNVVARFREERMIDGS